MPMIPKSGEAGYLDWSRKPRRWKRVVYPVAAAVVFVLSAAPGVPTRR